MVSCWKLNRMYIDAVNSDDTEEINRFFDTVSEDERYFTRRRYIWNLIRGKEFCRLVAEWSIDWYRRASVLDKTGNIAMLDVVRTLHWIMSTETHEKIKRSLVWKITKYAPIVTIDTVPYISPERIRNILNSDRWIVTDVAMEPIVNGYSELLLDLTNTKAALTAVGGLVSN